jgi:acyl-coenzyme A thioesterase PaaI-like protein
MSINLNITYLEQGHGRLTGTGRVLRSGRTVIAAEAEAHDARGTLVAKASGTMRVRLAGRTAD